MTFKSKKTMQVFAEANNGTVIINRHNLSIKNNTRSVKFNFENPVKPLVLCAN